MRIVTRCVIGLVLLLTVPSWAATTVTVGTDPTKFVMKGKIVTPDQVIDGELGIEADTIICRELSRSAGLYSPHGIECLRHEQVASGD